ncbi:alpha-1,4-glucan--maltose-1-phosphate maltosyltransferase [Namhaeicola litoreus]|uniref:Alpha-1,4-glucan:maltose-1-phosphate maltosyltransferase n=1 Tax=Namhaeicola litoreus TaxID=1052145 RepID=A0ABW3XZ27_9FLAO
MKRQNRVVIERVSPQINCGEFFIKRIPHQKVVVRADVLADGHDLLGASVLYKHKSSEKWEEARMKPEYNDAWIASFTVEQQGFYHYKVQGWVDHGLNWQHGIVRKLDDHQHVKSELLEGARLLEAMLDRVKGDDKKYITFLIEVFKDEHRYETAIYEARSERIKQILFDHPDKYLANETKEFDVFVDRKKALFSTWYEFFPRSATTTKGKHGTFKDCEKLLPRISKMGFDTLYFPPIHPIGEVNRKGKNNTTNALEGDVGSCWGIGSKFGGHKDIHPELGTLDDFKQLIQKAQEAGLEVAMDYALQAAPDHPWVKSNPEWFKWRPDGTVQYAENPPKKYQDILPIYFESEKYEDLWDACLEILLFWIDCGIRIFRVDNPHTKPFYFWNWIIAEVQKKYPDVIFLAEAFTKPKVMQQLAKQGFTQSYTYFTWRENKHELIEYMEELTKSESAEYMRPNFWPNTPDINPFHLQGANESKHIQRYVLAATLSSSIGIYGPVYELMQSEALPGREEYLHSEKFEFRKHDWNKKNYLIDVITKINQIRKDHEALQQTNHLRFCEIHNDNLIAFYKYNEDRTDQLLIVINLDMHQSQQGYVQLPLYDMNGNLPLRIKDLFTGYEYEWFDEWNFVQLHPNLPFHIFKLLT